MSTKEIDTIKKPKEFLVGEKDNAGVIIEKIYNRTLDFIVYRTSGQIQVEIDDDSPILEEYLNNFGKITVDLTRVYSWLPERLKLSEPINRQIARALFENMRGKQDTAKRMLVHAEQRIKVLKTISGRLQYTLSGLAMAGAIFIVLVILSATYTEYTLLSKYYCYSKIAFCGALGGIISIALGFPKLEIDLDANFITNCLIGSSRIIISIAAAIFSYFAIKSGVAFSFLTNGEQETGIYVVAMISGFSEMLIPNIMTNLSSHAEDDKVST